VVAIRVIGSKGNCFQKSGALSGFKLRVVSHVPRLVGRSRFDSSTLIFNTDATLVSSHLGQGTLNSAD